MKVLGWRQMRNVQYSSLTSLLAISLQRMPMFSNLISISVFRLKTFIAFKFAKTLSYLTIMLLRLNARHVTATPHLRNTFFIMSFLFWIILLLSIVPLIWKKSRCSGLADGKDETTLYYCGICYIHHYRIVYSGRSHHRPIHNSFRFRCPTGKTCHDSLARHRQ